MTKRWHTREDSGIRLDAEGRFWHDGEPISNANVARAFHRGLKRFHDGRFIVTFGWDHAFIQVDDAPYQVLGLAPGSVITLRLDDETEEPLDPASLCASPEGVVYARVKQGSAETRFSRAAQGQLAAFLVERDGQLWFESGVARARIAERTFVPVPPPNPAAG